MWRKLLFLISFLLVLGLVGSALAKTYVWDYGASPDQSWCTGANWNPDAEAGDPNDKDSVTLSTTLAGPKIDCDVNVVKITGPNPGETSDIVVDIAADGNLIVTDQWDASGGEQVGKLTVNIWGDLTVLSVDTENDDNYDFRTSDNADGYVNIFPGANVYVEGWMRGADEDGTYEVTMTGGDVNVGKFKIGDNGSGNFYLLGGNMVCRDYFSIRGRGGAYFEVLIDGGANLIVEGPYAAPEDQEAGAKINLDNGYIECRVWAARGESWVLDINEGMLRIKDPKLDYDDDDYNTNDLEDEAAELGMTPMDYMKYKIQGWIDAEQITGYNGEVVPIVTEDGADIVVTVTFLHVRAWKPSPAHRIEHVCPNDVNLAWTPGVYAKTQDIYFGDSTDDVNGVKDPCVTGLSPDVNTWTPPGPFEMGKTYYWKVDTANDACYPHEWEGGVWQFKIDDGRAFNPSPEDDDRGTKYTEVTSLSWTPSCLGQLQHVYYGRNFEDDVKLFDDEFERGYFDPNWSADPNWEVWDANEDPNFDPYDHNVARIIAASGTLEMIVDANATKDDPCAISVEFGFRKTGEIQDGEILLYYWNGSTWDFIKDLNDLDPNDEWIDFTDDINELNESQYFIPNFKIKFVANITSGGTVHIADVEIDNTWPCAARWFKGTQDMNDTDYSVSVDPYVRYGWRIDTVVDGNTVQGEHWEFRPILADVLMWYHFDEGPPSAQLASPISDATGRVEFETAFDPCDLEEEHGLVRYATSNPIYGADTGYSARFDPNVGLVRFDPCKPDSEEPLRLAVPQYTVELWMYPLSEPEYEDWQLALIEKYDDDCWSIEIDDNYQFEFFHEGDDVESDDDLLELQEGTFDWIHVAGVYDKTDRGKEVKIYINGILHNTESNDDENEDDSNHPVSIGCRSRADGRLYDFFHGMIDEVRIMDVALGPGDFLLVPGPEWASKPNPGNGQAGIDPNDPNQTIITWRPGIYAATHKVYFSTDFDDVNTGSMDAYIGEFEVNEVNSLDLAFGTTYYWRVDEVNAAEGGPWPGVVWRFTTRFLLVDPNMLLWYKFDEEGTKTVIDYSGYENHGDGKPLPLTNWETTGGRFGGCLKFDNDTGIDVPKTLFDEVDDQISVSVWVNGKPTQFPDDDMVVFDVGFEGSPFKTAAFIPSKMPEADVYWRAGNDTNDLLRWDTEWSTVKAWRDNWHHLVFIKNEIEDKMYIYFDGELKWWKKDTIDKLTSFRRSPFKIGAYAGEDTTYEGKMDDFRVYRKALSATEVLELFRGGDLNVAWAPSPYDAQPDAPHDTHLTWKPGDQVADHNVFFGTSWADVNNMTEPCATKGLGSEDYDPGLLKLDTYYYWRVDEVNGPCTWPGPVWEFKVADYIPVDDFEAYNYTTNKIEETWCDYYPCQYYNPPMTCSWLLLGEYPWDPVYPGGGGNQSMKYTYDMVTLNNGWAGVCYAEVSLPIPEQMKDWTVDVAVVRLYFYGDLDNDTNSTEQMYVGIEDTDGNYAEIRYGEYDPNNEDANDINEPEWHRWDIGLPHFNDTNYAAVANDINLASVAKFYIGFGNRRNPPERAFGCGGYGFVMFDDIRLYMPICKPEFGPIADFSGNCIVDMLDVAILGDFWLISDANFSPDEMQEPNDANLIACWRLDGDPNDSSGNNHNGVLEGIGTWVTGHNDANAADLAVEFGKGENRILVPDHNDLKPKHQVSACAWVYAGKQSAASRVVVKGADGKETYALEFGSDDQMNFYVRDSNSKEPDDFKNYAVHGRVWQDDWIHLAGTYDGNSVKCYVNGEFQEALDANFVVTGAFNLSQDINDLAIGNRSEETQNRQFIGTIDEVRLYDYGLSAAEVAWLATDGGGYVPLTLPYNLYDKEVPGKQAINLKDFAELLDDWMEEALWPASASP